MIWYDDILGCNKCGGCQDPCGCTEKKNCSCPNIIGWDCVVVDKTSPDAIVIDVQWPTQIISSDESLAITQSIDPHNCDAVVYDLSVDTEDVRVGACSQDTNPGFLYNDKLRVDTSGPLTYTLVNCPGDAYVKIGFNESKLQQIVAQDKRVAVNEACAPRYLDDAVIVWPWLTKEVVGCKLKVSLDCGDSEDCNNAWSNPSMQTYLSATVNAIQATNTQAAYYFSWTGVSELNALWWTHLSGNWRLDFKSGCVEHSSWVTTITKGGRYSVSFDGHQEQNKGVHGSRVGLVVIYPNGNLRLIQSRYSWLSSPFYASQTATPAEPGQGHYGNNITTTSLWWTGPTFSMGRVLARLPVGKHRRFAFPSGTKIVPFIRLSTVLSGDTDASNAAWQLSIIWEAEGSVGGADGFTYWVDYIDNVCDSLSWTDADACAC